MKCFVITHYKCEVVMQNIKIISDKHNIMGTFSSGKVCTEMDH